MEQSWVSSGAQEPGGEGQPAPSARADGGIEKDALADTEQSRGVQSSPGNIISDVVVTA